MFGPRPILLDSCERSVGIHVASTGTITQFAGGIFDIRVLRFLVRAGLICARMATGTIWLECRELPVDNLCVALVTVGTGKVVAVIERFVRQTCVAVIGWRPGIRVVASPAIHVRIEVPRILTRRKRAVMAR